MSAVRYQVPEDVMPGAHPHLAVFAFAPLVTFLLTAELFAAVLAIFNAWMLGCGDRRQQTIVIAAAYIGSMVFGAAQIAFMEAERGLAADITDSLRGLIVFAMAIYAYHRQHVVADFQLKRRAWAQSIGCIAALVALHIFILRPIAVGDPMARVLLGVH